jgi:hypothetical protein
MLRSTANLTRDGEACLFSYLFNKLPHVAVQVKLSHLTLAKKIFKNFSKRAETGRLRIKLFFLASKDRWRSGSLAQEEKNWSLRANRAGCALDDLA